MKNLTSLLAMLALVGSATMVSAQGTTPPAKDDCKQQSTSDQDACAPAVFLGGLGTNGAVAIGGMLLAAIAFSNSGSH